MYNNRQLACDSVPTCGGVDKAAASSLTQCRFGACCHATAYARTHFLIPALHKTQLLAAVNNGACITVRLSNLWETSCLDERL